MKSTVEHKGLGVLFVEVYETLKERILQNGFLLLHEINTQQIVSRHGITIHPLRQFFFLNPDTLLK
ncbi:hypothetical protein [Flagellimonas sp. S3867]|uniref:hypothetical protein n=1 Tax=Flagellimonas sp. S3867 TaxID=2768063 RepID=UPI0016859BC6|nr:hypothetical protein [Flagellimonas sp. S3867]